MRNPHTTLRILQSRFSGVDEPVVTRGVLAGGDRAKPRIATGAHGKLPWTLDGH